MYFIIFEYVFRYVFVFKFLPVEQVKKRYHNCAWLICTIGQ